MNNFSRFSLRDWFFITFFLSLAVKFAIAALVPIISEEAFWVDWAEHLDFGYFDHPPLVAWIIHPLLYLGKTEVIVRLPAILFSAFIGIGIYNLLKDLDREKAYLITIFFLISPANIFNSFITHNTPLELFSFFTGFFLFKALKTKSLGYYALSGLLLGLAILSKYLAILLGGGYFLYFLVVKKDKRDYFGFALFLLCCLLPVAIHLYWNYTHCWYGVTTFMIRYAHADNSFSPLKPFAYLLTIIYLASPPALYYLVRNWKNPLKIKAPPFFGLFFFLFLVPILFFLFSSFKIIVGLHWLIAYFTFFFLLLYLFLKEAQLISTIKFTFFFSLIHLMLIMGFVFSPLKWWEKTEYYHLIVFWRHADQLTQYFEPYRQEGYVLATYDYIASAVMAFNMNQYFPPLAHKGYFGRQDDLLTDYRTLDRKNFLILVEYERDLKKFVDYFDQAELKIIKVFNTSMYLVEGYGFRYDIYKEKHLKMIKEKYYNIVPDYLPMKACKFLDYFNEEAKSP